MKQAEVLVQATVAVSEAVHRLRKSRKLSELQRQADRDPPPGKRRRRQPPRRHEPAVRRAASTPLEVMKWKELYDLIEEAIDGCEDVGNTLERIVLKNG